MKTTIFSYGSNMSHQRILARVPSARFVVAGHLTHHALRWHKPGRDGSGKCDAYETGAASDAVWGGVFEIATSEKHRLDKAEGLGIGYREKQVTISCDLSENSQSGAGAAGGTVAATLYTAIPIEPEVKPYSWYKAFVVAGAKQCALSAHYIAMLEAVHALEDPDAERDAMNRAILARLY